jgi:hypothetical protein
VLRSVTLTMPIIIAIMILVLTATVVNGQDAASPSPLPVNPVCDWAFSQAVRRAQVSPAPALPTPTPGPSASPGPTEGGLIDSGLIVDRAFLDDAVRLCAGVADWEAAAALHPEALGTTDPLEFLAERCADPTAGLEVYSTCVSLMRALATPPPTPVPTPMPSLSPAPSSAAGQSAWTAEARATARQYRELSRRLYRSTIPNQLLKYSLERLRASGSSAGARAAARRQAAGYLADARQDVRAHQRYLTRVPALRCYRDAYAADRSLARRSLVTLRSGQLDDWGRLRRSYARFVQRLDGFFDDCR